VVRIIKTPTRAVPGEIVIDCASCGARIAFAPGDEVRTVKDAGRTAPVFLCACCRAELRGP